MPIRHHNIFAELPTHLKKDVNPYLEKIIEAQNSGELPLKFGPALRNMPGNWNDAFIRKPHKLLVEIGIHKGKTVCQMASDFRDDGFVGFDITFKRVVTSAERAKTLGLENVMTALANAKNIDRLFAPAEVDGCIIFFPDPWLKKKRQKHNQLLDFDFCQKMKTILKSSGFFWLKTDQLPYFSEVEAHLKAAGFLQSDAGSLANEPLVNRIYESTFERRFKILGLPTYEGLWVKP